MAVLRERAVLHPLPAHRVNQPCSTRPAAEVEAAVEALGRVAAPQRLEATAAITVVAVAEEELQGLVNCRAKVATALRGSQSS
jgi:hypothetical protein